MQCWKGSITTKLYDSQHKENTVCGMNVITGESEEFKPVSSEDINLSSQTTTLDNAIHSLLV